jgi:hypothetical protein
VCDSGGVVEPFPSPLPGVPLRLGSLARMLFDSPYKTLGTLVGVVVSVFLMAHWPPRRQGALYGVSRPPGIEPALEAGWGKNWGKNVLHPAQFSHLRYERGRP